MLERYQDLVELARIYMQLSRATKAKDVAAHLRRMAKEYQRSAVRGVRRLPHLPDRNAPTRACWAERQRAGTCRQHLGGR
jgi:hypothetical protein